MISQFLTHDVKVHSKWKSCVGKFEVHLLQILQSADATKQRCWLSMIILITVPVHMYTSHFQVEKCLDSVGECSWVTFLTYRWVISRWQITLSYVDTFHIALIFYHLSRLKDEKDVVQNAFTHNSVPFKYRCRLYIIWNCRLDTFLSFQLNNVSTRHIRYVDWLTRLRQSTKFWRRFAMIDTL